MPQIETVHTNVLDPLSSSTSIFASKVLLACCEMEEMKGGRRKRKRRAAYRCGGIKTTTTTQQQQADLFSPTRKSSSQPRFTRPRSLWLLQRFSNLLVPADLPNGPRIYEFQDFLCCKRKLWQQWLAAFFVQSTHHTHAHTQTCVKKLREKEGCSGGGKVINQLTISNCRPCSPPAFH